MSRATVAVLFVMLVACVAAHAGGPMLVGGPTFGIDGQPFVWDNTLPIHYRTDSGPLGSIDNTTANAHLQQAFAKWTQVSTATISAQGAGAIQGVTNGDVKTMADFDTVYGSCTAGTQTPIVYDSDGSLFSQLMGDSSIIGFASMCKLSSNGHIQSAILVLTGGAGLSLTDQDKIMTHEIGHLLGLDHSLPGTNPCGTSQDDINALPMMYYEISGQSNLTADDKAWISKLYPSSSYRSMYGTITGKILFSDGQNAVQDVLVSAHPASPGSMAGEDRKTAISSISGYRFTGNLGQPYTADYLACNPESKCQHGYYGNNADGDSFGSRQIVLVGLYEIPVPAGSYSVQVSGLDWGGDIGPINPPLPIPGPGEYWSADESATDSDFSHMNCTVQQKLDYVSVQAGGTTANVDVIINGTAPPLDIFESADGLSPSSGVQTAQGSVSGGRQ